MRWSTYRSANSIFMVDSIFSTFQIPETSSIVRPCCMDHPGGCLIIVFSNTGDNLLGGHPKAANEGHLKTGQLN